MAESFDPEKAGVAVAQSGFDPEAAGVAVDKKPSAERSAGMIDLTPAQRVGALLLGPVGFPLAASGKRPSLETVKSLGLNSGGAAVGAYVGSLVGPVGTGVGAVAGGLLGNLTDQSTRPGQTGIRKGELLASGLTSYVPGVSTITRGAMPLVREAALAGGRGLLAKGIETEIDEGRLPTGTEAVLASAVPAAGGAAAGRIQQGSAATQAAEAIAAGQTAVKRETVDAAKKLGMVVPVSEVNPGIGNNIIEGAGGGTAVRQQASKTNEKVAADVARREIGLPKESPLNVSALEGVRAEAGKAYQAIGDLSKDQSTIQALAVVNPDYAETVANAARNLELLKQARADANGYFKFADRTGDPAQLKLARDYQSQADALEVEIEKAATYSGRLELFDALKAARTRIAKTYNIERAMNLGDGTISAREFGKALEKGAPLSGDMETIAKFSLAFPNAVKESTQTGMAGVSKMDYGLGTLAGMSTLTGTGNPLLAAATTMAPGLTSYGARRLVLSRPYQKAMANVPLGDVRADPELLAQILAQTAQAAGQNR